MIYSVSRKQNKRQLTLNRQARQIKVVCTHIFDIPLLEIRNVRESQREISKKTEGGEERLRAVVDVLHVLVHGWPGVRRSFIRRLKQKSSRVGGASVNNAGEDRSFFCSCCFCCAAQHKFRGRKFRGRSVLRVSVAQRSTNFEVEIHKFEPFVVIHGYIHCQVRHVLQNLVFRRRHGDAEAHVGRMGSVVQCYKPPDV